MYKQIQSINNLQFNKDAPGFDTINLTNNQYPIEPFLVFTEFNMNQPIFGPHPHAGISVMTYMMPDSLGSFVNRDSLGDKSIIEPGGVHVTQAGMGIFHEELPTVIGTNCHGFQIWINHSDANRLVEPKSFHAFSKDIQEWKSEGVDIRIIQGKFMDKIAPFEILTKTTMLDVYTQGDTSVKFETEPMVFVYLMSGSIQVGDAIIDKPSIINFVQSGEGVNIVCKTKSNFLFISGTPHNETIVQGGPFVMTTPKQMEEANIRVRSGKMGTLSSTY
jgi:quercetin 2,3-dioxygenase